MSLRHLTKEEAAKYEPYWKELARTFEFMESRFRADEVESEVTSAAKAFEAYLHMIHDRAKELPPLAPIYEGLQFMVEKFIQIERVLGPSISLNNMLRMILSFRAQMLEPDKAAPTKGEAN